MHHPVRYGLVSSSELALALRRFDGRGALQRVAGACAVEKQGFKQPRDARLGALETAAAAAES